MKAQLRLPGQRGNTDHSTATQVESGKQTSAGLARAPYLAPVDLAWRAKQLAVEGEAELRVVPRMLAYFARFQAKAVAYVDLVKYATLLGAQERAQFAEGLEEVEGRMEAEVLPSSVP